MFKHNGTWNILVVSKWWRVIGEGSSVVWSYSKKDQLAITPYNELPYLSSLG